MTPTSVTDYPCSTGGRAAVSAHDHSPSDRSLAVVRRKVPSWRCRTGRVAMPRRTGWPSRDPYPGMETSRDGLPVSYRSANQRETGPPPERRRTSVLLGGSSERWLDSSGGPRSGGEGARPSSQTVLDSPAPDGPPGPPGERDVPMSPGPAITRSKQYQRCPVLPLRSLAVRVTSCSINTRRLLWGGSRMNSV